MKPVINNFTGNRLTDNRITSLKHTVCYAGCVRTTLFIWLYCSQII